MENYLLNECYCELRALLKLYLIVFNGEWFISKVNIQEWQLRVIMTDLNLFKSLLDQTNTPKNI